MTQNSTIDIVYFTQSLKTPERLEFIKKNQLIMPEMKIFEAVNGYDVDGTIKTLKDMKLKYIRMCRFYEKFGMLANFLTKVKAFQYQIEHNIQYMCLIEDDLIIQKNFKEFIESKLHLLEDCNMLRLDKWGEGYVTSLNGAKNIVKEIYSKGIICNPDIQLREHCGKEIRINNTPWELAVPTNQGDCLKTAEITPAIRRKLNKLN